MPRRAQCRYTAFAELAITIPFGQAPAQAKAFIADLKDAVPYKFRTYDPAAKEWRVWGGFEELAIALLVESFPDAELPSRAHSHAKPQTRHAGSDHFQILHLLPSAPPELIAAAYRTLAKLSHPDVGGDSATMRRLTEAHEALSRRLSA